MCTSPEPGTVLNVGRCAVCGSSSLASAVFLPGLPLTGLYCPDPPAIPPQCYDQELLLCAECGHAQAAYQLHPSLLYDATYAFRTSSSATAQAAGNVFLRALDGFAKDRVFRAVLELGCNDLNLLKLFKGRIPVRMGIDPIWNGRDGDPDDPEIQVVGDLVEEVELNRVLGSRPDLVLCQHTLEHIAQPRAVIESLVEFAEDDALFLFEVPGLEALVARRRFDQVFHQHFQYFSLRSFQRLIHEVGAEYVGAAENYHHWGTIIVAFRKGRARMSGSERSPLRFGLEEIQERYRLFRHQLAGVNRVLESCRESGEVFGYGAAQMLPVLGYHMGTDFSTLTAVLDDDPGKDGWFYANLAPRIRRSASVSGLEDATIFLTAPDNFKPILARLLSLVPKHILLPFNLM